MKRFVFLMGAALMVFAFAIMYQSPNKKDNQNSSDSEPKVVTISQYQLKKDYGWKDIIMWLESKEDFEKVYSIKLNNIDQCMGFKKDPTCSDPAGGDSEWKDIKVCFNYIWPPNTPDILSEIATQSKGKTLVLIGFVYNNNENFLAQVYWY